MAKAMKMPEEQVDSTVPEETFTAAISERGQVVIPIALRKRVGLSTGDELVWWVNAHGHLEAEPARAVRARAHKSFLAEARAIADETADQWPDKSVEEILGDIRR
jgi:bifunctional DNA-binding transcriptional regulator/antitoxin component of YhaV-PrlF toxin-antitoxin module